MKKLFQNHPGYDNKNAFIIVFQSMERKLISGILARICGFFLSVSALSIVLIVIFGSYILRQEDKVFFELIVFWGFLFTPIIIYFILMFLLTRKLKKEQEQYYKETESEYLSLEQREGLRLDVVMQYTLKNWSETLEPKPVKEFVSNPKNYKILPLKSQKDFAIELYEDWGIYDENSYNETIQALWKGMHSKPFAYEMTGIENNNGYINDELVNKYAFLLNRDSKSIIEIVQPQCNRAPLLVWGFDLRRAIWVSRMAYCSGLITKQQAWHDIKITSDYTHALFSSFDEYHQNYLLGFAYWNNDHNQIAERINSYEEFKKKCQWDIAKLSWRQKTQDLLPEYIKKGFKKDIINHENIDFLLFNKTIH